jgi:hypothetical protein
LRLILDGQQRITGLFRALKGADEVWYIVKDAEGIDPKVNDMVLEKNLKEFTGAESEDELSIRLSNIWKFACGEITREKDKSEILEKSKFFKKLNPGKETHDHLVEVFLTLTGALVDLVKSEKLLTYYLLDTSVENFALFFERSNSTGLRLSFTDILAAKLYHDFHLREKQELFANEYPAIRLYQEHAVRVIAYLASGGSEVKQPWILKNLEASHFKLYWDRVVKLYAEVVEYLLRNHWIVSQKLMPYDNMVVPLMVFADNLPSGKLSQANGKQIAFLEYWYWSSLFGERYSAKTNETILADAHLLTQIAKEEQITDAKQLARMFVSQIPSADALVDINTPTSALFRAVLSLVNQQSGGSLDWKSGKRLTQYDNLESHHIFPKQFMRDQYKGPKGDAALAESVANRAYTSKITNIKIADKAPIKYLAELAAGNPNLKSVLESHLIDPGIINGDYERNFEGFLTERAERLFGAIERVTSQAAEAAIAPFAKRRKRSA